MTSMVGWLNEVASVWWAWVIHASWQSALIALVLLGLVASRRRWPAPWRYALLVVALLKFLCPPLLPAPTGILSRVSPPVRLSAPAPRLVLQDVQTLSTMRVTGPALAQGTTGSTDRQLNRSQEPDRITAPIRRDVADWKGWLLLLHAVGTVMMLTWVGVQWTRIRHWVRQSQPVTDAAICGSGKWVRSRHSANRTTGLREHALRDHREKAEG